MRLTRVLVIHQNHGPRVVATSTADVELGIGAIEEALWCGGAGVEGHVAKTCTSMIALEVETVELGVSGARKGLDFELVKLGVGRRRRKG